MHSQAGFWSHQLPLLDRPVLEGPAWSLMELSYSPWPSKHNLFPQVQSSRQPYQVYQGRQQQHYPCPHGSPADYNGNVNGVGSFLSVETDVGRGPGIVRLLQDKDGKWKAFTLFTAMHELKGHEETIRGNRSQGIIHGGNPRRKNWQKRRIAIENVQGDLEPTVLIFGI